MRKLAHLALAALIGLLASAGVFFAIAPFSWAAAHNWSSLMAYAFSVIIVLAPGAVAVVVARYAYQRLAGTVRQER